MKRNIFPASIFIIVLIAILSSSDFSFAQEEHSLMSHDDEIENTSAAEHTEDHSSHEIEPSMEEMEDMSESDHIDDTPDDIHKHTSVTAEIAQWIGVGTLLAAALIFTIRMRSANKLGYKDVVLTLALGVGIMHVLLVPDHLIELGIEHGIFFAVIGSTQIGFGLLFIAKPTRSLAIIGIVGTIGSIVLYFITRMGELESLGFPEGMDQVGIIAKMVEISMIVILTYLIVYLKKEMSVGITKETKK